MKIYHKSVRAYLLLLLAVVFVLNAVVSWRLPVWHPRNELAHYDYIDKLADLQIPRPGDRISQYSYDITLDHFEWKQPDDFDGSIESMGIEGESYEAQQPPVYYLLLAGPNALLKKLGVDPLNQIRLLRMCQWAIALNFLLSLYRSCGSRRTERDFVVLLSCLVAIAILGAGTLLNEVRPGVRWGGFRHFFGYQLFWYIAIFHPPFRFSPRWRELVQSVVIIGMSILAIRYGMVVFSLNP